MLKTIGIIIAGMLLFSGCSEDLLSPSVDSYVINLTYTTDNVQFDSATEYNEDDFKIEINKQKLAYSENSQWFLDHNVQLSWFKYEADVQTEAEITIVDGVWIGCADCGQTIINVSNEYGTPTNTSYINNGDYWKWTWEYRDEDNNITDRFTFEEDPTSIECCDFTQRHF